jgi:hypothetical protein
MSALPPKADIETGFATFTAIRRASSRVSGLAADRGSSK